MIQFPMSSADSNLPWHGLDVGLNAHAGGGFLAGAGEAAGAQFGLSSSSADPIHTGADPGMNLGAFAGVVGGFGANAIWNPFDDENKEGDPFYGLCKGSLGGGNDFLTALLHAKGLTAKFGEGFGGGVNVGPQAGYIVSLHDSVPAISAANAMVGEGLQHGGSIGQY